MERALRLLKTGQEGRGSLHTQSRMEQQGLLQDITTSKSHAMTKPPVSEAMRRYWMFMFILTLALLCADQNLLAPHLTQAAHDFGMTDEQRDQLLGGYIMAAFFALGVPSSLLVGYLTDRCNRRNLLFAVVMLGATPVLLTYWVTAYWQLLVLRMLTGISIGGVGPLIFSLLGDLYHASERCSMASLLGTCAGLGGLIGQAVSDWTGGSNWRVPFRVVSLPTLLCAVVMVATTEDPPRGGCEEGLQQVYAGGGEYIGNVSWASVKQVLAIKSNWLIFLQGIPGCLPWGMAATYLNDYLAQDKGLTVHMATTLLLVCGVGAMGGSLVGGVLGQWLYNQRKELMPLLSGSCVVLSIPTMLYLVNAPLTRVSLAMTMVIALVGGAIMGMAVPSIRAVTMNVNQPETRGVVFALAATTDDLGKGLGPFLVARFIKVLGRQKAFNVAILGWVPCGLMLMALALTIREDEAAMQQRLRQADAWGSTSSSTGSRAHDDDDELEVEMGDAAVFVKPSSSDHAAVKLGQLPGVSELHAYAHASQ